MGVVHDNPTGDEPERPLASFRQSCGATLSFSHVSYVVRVRAEERGPCARVDRQLLSECSASVAAGEILAILGPSGAGKTTLLSALALEDVGGCAFGSVTLNGQPFAMESYQAHAAYVAQSDQLWPFLSAREHLEVAVALYQPQMVGPQCAAAVDELLKETGLEEAQHVRAGGALFKGLSGGQRRRLSLGVALAKRPSVVLADEPTSGLDAASASSIMRLLKQTTQRLELAMVCTIHQPSTSVYAEFGSVLFLTGGEVAYLGAADELVSYLDGIGKPMPACCNPADFMLDLINPDFSDGALVELMRCEWRRRRPALVEPSPSSLPAARVRSRAVELRVLYRRHLTLTLRDPALFLVRLVGIVVSSIFFGAVFIESRNEVQSQVLQRCFAVFFMLMLGPSITSILVLLSSHQELSILRREVKEGMYSPLTYVVVQATISVPMAIALMLFAFVPAAEGMCNLPWSAFGESLLVGASLFWTCEMFARYFSLMPSPILGLLMHMSTFLLFLVFNGLMIRLEDVIWPFRIYSYIDPMRYAYRDLIYLAFRDSSYGGAVPCNITSASCPRGFTCLGDSPLDCYGVTSSQILSALHTNYDAISAGPSVGEDVSCILGIGAAALLLYTLNLVLQSRHTARMKPPRSSGTESSSSQPGGAPQVDELQHPRVLSPNGSRRSTPTCVAGRRTRFTSIAGNGDSSNEPERPLASFRQSCGATLSFSHVSYVVRVRAEERGPCARVDRQLLSECSASVAAGEILAILGPSGAGKTTLLSALALEDVGGCAFGSVMLNGQPFAMESYQAHAAYVAQSDQLWSFLSAREHLEVAVALYQPQMVGPQCAAAVDELLKETGLEEAQHVRAGGALFKGLSGGQRRRLSLGVALAKRPSVVLADEPTSGLDAASASSIMRLLKQTTQRLELAMVCTIHQPSTSVYAEFGSVLFLTGGEVAYFGAADELVSYLDGIGKPMPACCNPADFMLDLINPDFSDGALVELMRCEWRRRRPALVEPSPSSLPAAHVRSLVSELRVLYRRHLTLTLRDPALFLARLPTFILFNAMLAVFFIYGRGLKQSMVITRLFYVMLSLTSVGRTLPFPNTHDFTVYSDAAATPMMMFALITTFVLNAEATSLRREIKEGMYPPMSYVFVQSTIQVVMIYLLALAALAPSSYPIMALPSEGFGPSLFVFGAQLLAFECQAQFFSLEPNPLLGFFSSLGLWQAAFLFSGIYVPRTDVIWPFRLFGYVLPYAWAFPSLVHAAFFYVDNYENAYRCNVTTFLAVDGPAVESSHTHGNSSHQRSGSTVLCIPFLDSDGFGFFCDPSVPAESCFGRTGAQVLTSIGRNYEPITAEPTWLRDGLVCLGVALFFKLCFALRLLRLVSRSATVHRPKEVVILSSDQLTNGSTKHGTECAVPPPAPSTCQLETNNAASETDATASASPVRGSNRSSERGGCAESDRPDMPEISTFRRSSAAI